MRLRRRPVSSPSGVARAAPSSTIALDLAYALGSVAPTVLVDLDLSASALTAYLDRDPSRNICTLAHAVRTEATTWSAALDRELQPLSEPANHARVLCGPPKPEMRGSLSPAFVERLVPELARRFRYVILDVGAEVLGGDAAPNNHRAALASAAEILLVSGADLASLWHARAALDHLEQQLDVTRVRVPLVLNASTTGFTTADPRSSGISGRRSWRPFPTITPPPRRRPRRSARCCKCRAGGPAERCSSWPSGCTPVGCGSDPSSRPRPPRVDGGSAWSRGQPIPSERPRPCAPTSRRSWCLLPRGRASRSGLRSHGDCRGRSAGRSRRKRPCGRADPPRANRRSFQSDTRRLPGGATRRSARPRGDRRRGRGLRAAGRDDQRPAVARPRRCAAPTVRHGLRARHPPAAHGRSTGRGDHRQWSSADFCHSRRSQGTGAARLLRERRRAPSVGQTRGW